MASRRSLPRALFYACGMLAAGTLFAFSSFTLPLYISLMGHGALAAWLGGVRLFSQALVQSIVGIWSDRTWTRLGRRAPFFLGAAVLISLVLLLLVALPGDSTAVLVAAILVASIIFYDVAYAPYQALLADITPSRQRGTVSGMAHLFWLVGIVILIGGAYLWYGTDPSVVFMLVVAVLLTGFGMVALGVRERKVRARENSVRRRGGFNQYVLALFHEQPNALRWLGARLSYQCGMNAGAAGLTLFVVSDIGLSGWGNVLAALPFLLSFGLDKIDPRGLAQLFAALIVVTTGLFAPMFGILGDRFGRERIFSAGLFVAGGVALFTAMAVNAPQLLVLSAGFGIANAGLVVLFYPRLADLVPNDRYGEFAGLTGFADSAGILLGMQLTLYLTGANLFALQYRLAFFLAALFLGLALVLSALTFRAEVRSDRT